MPIDLHCKCGGHSIVRVLYVDDANGKANGMWYGFAWPSWVISEPCPCIQLCLTSGLCELLGKGVRYGREQPTGTRDVNIGAYVDADDETNTDVEGEQEGDGQWTSL